MTIILPPSYAPPPTHTRTIPTPHTDTRYIRELLEVLAIRDRQESLEDLVCLDREVIQGAQDQEALQ